jgi:8-oxo-dGTP pyrophosphatase MutT (NUDIX family)
LRETREEIGIGPDSIRVLGRLPQHFTGTGFVITPVVGLLYPPLTFVPDPDEVAEIFEVPLGVLMDPEGHKPESHVVNGIDRHYFAIYHEHRRIWGATARILIELSHILADAQPD